MHLFAKERGPQLTNLLRLPEGALSPDTFERVSGRIESKSLLSCLELYGKEILSVLSEKQIISDGKKLKGASPTGRGNGGVYILNA